MDSVKCNTLIGAKTSAMEVIGACRCLRLRADVIAVTIAAAFRTNPDEGRSPGRRPAARHDFRQCDDCKMKTVIALCGHTRNWKDAFASALIEVVLCTSGFFFPSEERRNVVSLSHMDYDVDGGLAEGCDRPSNRVHAQIAAGYRH
jgi:hypothetical protein